MSELMNGLLLFFVQVAQKPETRR